MYDMTVRTFTIRHGYTDFTRFLQAVRSGHTRTFRLLHNHVLTTSISEYGHVFTLTRYARVRHTGYVALHQDVVLHIMSRLVITVRTVIQFHGLQLRTFTHRYQVHTVQMMVRDE